jgi:hypothetical protein
MPSVSLSALLGLRPLDRLQLNTPGMRRDHGGCLPWWYFQREHDGRLEVSSPGGSLDWVKPEEVCSILPGEPIVVHALPQAAFLDHLRRKTPITNDSFRPARLLRLRRDRWRRIEPSAWVSFDDGSLNDSPTFMCPLRDDSRAAVRDLTRNVVPIVSCSSDFRSASASAERGLSRASDKARREVSRFLLSRCQRVNA